MHSSVIVRSPRRQDSDDDGNVFREPLPRRQASSVAGGGGVPVSVIRLNPRTTGTGRPRMTVSRSDAENLSWAGNRTVEMDAFSDRVRRDCETDESGALRASRDTLVPAEKVGGLANTDCERVTYWDNSDLTGRDGRGYNDTLGDRVARDRSALSERVRKTADPFGDRFMKGHHSVALEEFRTVRGEQSDCARISSQATRHVSNIIRFLK